MPGSMLSECLRQLAQLIRFLRSHAWSSHAILSKLHPQYIMTLSLSLSEVSEEQLRVSFI